MRNILFGMIIVVVFLFAYKYFEQAKYGFTLEGINGPVSLKDFKGKKVILYFGYTSCPDVCPTELSMLGKQLDSLKNANKAQVIFISLDPQRDTNVTEATQFVQFFYKPAIALLANAKQLKEITKHYGVQYQRVDLKDSYMKYSIAHSGEFYLIDQNGKFLGPIKDLTRANFRKKLKAFLAN